MDDLWLIRETQPPNRGKCSMTKPTNSGGYGKNRSFDGRIALPAGDYVLRYRSGRLSTRHDWNIYPPDIPRMLGPSPCSELARR